MSSAEGYTQSRWFDTICSPCNGAAPSSWRETPTDIVVEHRYIEPKWKCEVCRDTARTRTVHPASALNQLIQQKCRKYIYNFNSNRLKVADRPTVSARPDTQTFFEIS